MRADNPLTRKGVYEFGNFRLNTAERVVESAGRPLSVAPKALDVLIELVENRGRIVEKEDLMRKVWPDTFVEDNNLAFNISVLRKLFGESGASPRYIETVPKRGYRFIADVVEVQEDEPPAVPVATATSVPAPIPILKRLPGRPLALAALLILAMIGLVASRSKRDVKVMDPETVVLADFVNKTGEAVFDGTLDQGLAVQLGQSPFLSLVSAGRVRRTLRLMGQPANARLTPELAREVCERVAGTAVVDGSIARLGSQYVLGLRARNCGTGDILDDEQAPAGRKEDVLDALSQTASRLRARFGESVATVRSHDTPLAEATTPSLEALKAYSAGLKVHFSSGARAALPFFKRAVEIDPEFAMAHAYLGRVYANLDESDLSAESIRKAWELRDRTSDRERFAIAVRYEALVTGNLDELRQTSEAWARLYPRDPQPYMGQTLCDRAAGQYDKAAAETRKAIEADPDFGIGYSGLAANYVYLGRLQEAEHTLKEAAGRGLDSDEFAMLRYDMAFLRGDQAGLQREAARARERSGGDNWISNKEAFALAYSGHLEQARRMSGRAVDQALQAGQRERAGLWEAGAAVREAFFGNAAEAKKRALAARELTKDREAEYGSAFALALSGDSSGAQALADDLEKRFPEDTSVRYSYLPVLRARLALNRGEASKALEVLQVSVPYELGVHGCMVHALFGALYPVYVRGEAYLASHRGAEAAGEFQKILDHRGIVMSDPVGVMGRVGLARALAMAGDATKAQIAYRAFLALWKDADADVPMLQKARAESAKLP
jgi:DNA-binding winged helix-turn-helix (wHTH) protein/tetratricopeptide (TPR) repeat protein